MATLRKLRIGRGLLLGLLLAAAPAAAQITIAEYWISADTNVRIPLTDGTGNVFADDRSTIIVLPDGTGAAQAPNVIFDFDGADVDAFHRTLGQTSLDTARVIDGVLVGPADVFYMSGSTPVITFDGAAAGVPDGVNLDAVTVDPDTGGLVVSFDRWFLEPNLGFVLPGDLIAVVDGQLDDIALNGAQFEPGVNLDAAHQLNADQFLISVDVDTRLPGGPGTLAIRDHDVVLYTAAQGGGAGTFEPIFSLAEESHPSWVPADLDALWAELAVDAGTVRFLVAQREVQESAGTVTVSVERIDGNESAVQARVTSVNGSAVAGLDYGAVDEVLDWADGAGGVRTFTVTVLDDGLEEDPVEDFSLQLAVESGEATLGTPATLTVRIRDNDGDNLFSDGFES